jgi:hypothetical protein
MRREEGDCEIENVSRSNDPEINCTNSDIRPRMETQGRDFLGDAIGGKNGSLTGDGFGEP